MMRWFLRGKVPVILVNERGRYQGFTDPGMAEIRGHTGLYIAREPDNGSPLWSETTAVRQPLERVERSWRGTLMDTYALEKLTGWTPELSPPPDTTFFRWRVLAFFAPSPTQPGSTPVAHCESAQVGQARLALGEGGAHLRAG
jgi:hypothetical protein